MAGAEAAALGSNWVALDLGELGLREVNKCLQSHNGTEETAAYRVEGSRGTHALACGLDAPVEVEILGHAGYYAAGMNQKARVTIKGNAGVGVAENMMSGEVRVLGDASQSAAATAHGGLLVVEGNAAARCGISLKGAEIVVLGSAGHMTGFMAQAGRIVVLGDVGEAMGDSIYEAEIYVGGSVESLGADCERKEMDAEHEAALGELLRRAGVTNVEPSAFKRYGSARRLYHFSIDNIDAY